MPNQNLKHCVPCEGGIPPLSPSEISARLKKLKAWNLERNSITKTYTFIDLRRAISFVNEVSDVAEFEGHHPDLNIHNWNKVTVTLQTHAIKGLSENDFIMAERIDQILEETKE